MKVRELIEQLQKLDPELQVIKQKDDEGNGFSQIYGLDGDAYSPNPDAYDAEVYASDDVDEMVEEYEEDRDSYKRVVVLY